MCVHPREGRGRRPPLGGAVEVVDEADDAAEAGDVAAVGAVLAADVGEVDHADLDARARGGGVRVIGGAVVAEEEARADEDEARLALAPAQERAEHLRDVREQRLAAAELGGAAEERGQAGAERVLVAERVAPGLAVVVVGAALAVPDAHAHQAAAERGLARVPTGVDVDVETRPKAERLPREISGQDVRRS